MENRIVKNILNKTFFKAWYECNYMKDKNKYENFASLEIQLTSSCDQRCSYCYYNKYGKILNDPVKATSDIILRNLDILLNWLTKNRYFPRIEIFSGEPFSSDLGFIVLDKIVDWYIANNIKISFVIPTNMSFILDDVKIASIETIFNKALKHDVYPILSASVDGIYMDEENRPFVNKKRTFDFYDKVFKFAKKWHIAFHPMIYSNGIEKWIDNFLWFQNKFKEYGIPWTAMYLLEVRNTDWSIMQIREFYKFVRFVVRYSIDKLMSLGVTEEELVSEIHKLKLFNIFSMFYGSGRGIGCSIQSTMQLRLHDLTVSPCHRTAYPQFYMYRFKVNNNEIVDIEALNYNLVPVLYSANHQTFPMCEKCAIRFLCNGTCLGSNYEYSGELFLPSPIVCMLEHAKVAALIDELESLGVLKYFYTLSKSDSLLVYEKYLRGS